ncbi:MAG: hypothetical protein RLZZ305_214 [Actinomycetota bacterium]
MTVWGRTPARFPDTAGYLVFDPLTPSSRLWPVTLAYWLVRNDAARVALQVLAGTAAWVWLASVLSRASRFPGPVRVVTLLLGLVPQMSRYDLAILSESLSISLGVALVAATTDVARRPRAGAWWAWTAVFVTFAMSRQQHLPLLFMAAAAVILSAAARRRTPPVRGLVVVVAALIGFVQLSSTSALSTLNMYTVLSERVISDDTRYSWFVAQGMPDVPGMREAGGYDYADRVPAELLADAGFPPEQAPPSLLRVGGRPLLEWVRGSGWRTLARWIVTRPGDTRERLLDLAGPALHPPNDDFLPLDTRTVVPRGLFPPWELSTVMTAAGAVFLLGSSRRRESAAIIVLFAGVSLLYSLAVTGSGIEHPRHAAVSAAMLAATALASVCACLQGRRADEVTN